MEPVAETHSRVAKFNIKVLGRTLEHMGVQMYKQRPTAIAELVANAWDAGATEVTISVPTVEEYDRLHSKIVITDTGSGMDETAVSNHYLVIGRNRRTDNTAPAAARPVMGRKGIGKLAGFGLAEKVHIKTWQGDEAIKFTLDVKVLKGENNQPAEVPIEGKIEKLDGSEIAPSGTKITLSTLKHPTPLDIDALHNSLARRFSRRIRGEMKITINGEDLREPDINSQFEREGDITLEDGNIIKYKYSCAEKPISSPELRGFTIYARGKTVQAPPFFFNVEATASGQHGTKYLMGEIEADFLDAGDDDESDIVSTDRQEIDWENEKVKSFFREGQKLARKAISECATKIGEDVKDWIIQQPQIASRLEYLDTTSQRQIKSILTTLGKGVSNPENKERVLELADGLMKAYEFRQFHDMVSTIEEIGDDPEKLETLLGHLRDWKVLESRAILEIVNGRLEIIDKFEKMAVYDAPETANRRPGLDNLHDLIGGYPWLLNPEWQVLTEEKTITTQLREWGSDYDADGYANKRFDFIALSDNNDIIIVEIKRAGHPVEFEELVRLETYAQKLSRGRPIAKMVLVYSGTLNVRQETINAWKQRPDAELIEWNELITRARVYYGHYKAVLTSDITNPDFSNKAREVVKTRSVLATGTVYRSPEERGKGLGSQDVKYEGDVT